MEMFISIIAFLSFVSSVYGLGIHGGGGGEVIWTDSLDIDVDSSATALSITDDPSFTPWYHDYYSGAGGAMGGSGSEKSEVPQADESVGLGCRSKFSNEPKDSADDPCTIPRIVKWHAEGTETTKMLRPGHTMFIECKLAVEDSDVRMHLNWFKDNTKIDPSDKHYTIFPENSTLKINSPTVEDVGVYQCQLGDIKAAQSYNITVVHLSFKSLPKSITVLNGDKLSITCEVEGSPMPIVTWFKDGQRVEDVINITRYELESNEKEVANTSYIVDQAIYDDRGNYTCSISTFGIQFDTSTFVRVKNIYAALWPFLGICAEVFILCLIIFVYEKRRAKADFEESDTDQPPEQKTPSDHNKDVRHRK